MHAHASTNNTIVGTSANGKCEVMLDVSCPLTDEIRLPHAFLHEQCVNYFIFVRRDLSLGVRPSIPNPMLFAAEKVDTDD